LTSLKAFVAFPSSSWGGAEVSFATVLGDIAPDHSGVNCGVPAGAWSTELEDARPTTASKGDEVAPDAGGLRESRCRGSHTRWWRKEFGAYLETTWQTGMIGPRY
jgi:hypothetical protein